ncbi:Asp-tRNA(Asn)/Glu-tRNA(Gln) amidotransferase subunit GatB [Paremcibacter congregatus]|uniref:Aspartyl/glutamyl-tRNA(Asn/Gln) amidotransferase subunit B n=1 Tax=Paremcibacter congregatus TaxID=2043170 RepID=A0A2G4YNC2_9PROT|nr:Asp-tRNA(Asn)/Glu-tRNA(Gln) amidotransferase subunit GatB [Paremcibacter congregatus]PHZ83797.1 Asp-tRNA(Asn)/Glu-tRNA(Gln) amidotransferase GatCAB subunit B [Paremcibacter congregatus]QDE27500.1 Asp-tRNA(Asn)/Glu-tRNA(Gln) amidotransferase subunit GatB [Paremcibacter congregatus]
MNKYVQGATGDWEVVIGLEIHAQVLSESKLFSGASTKFGGEPNTHVSFVCSAMPGMLPVINEECVRQAVRTGLAMGCQINLRSVFDRKNYFYADLPQGYQISQFKDPIVGEGELVVDLEDGSTKTIGVERLHLEQDAGKSMHDQHPSETYVDLNRSGVALMEIVSKPDMRSAEEAAAYFRKIRTIVRYAGTCDGNMDQGSMRADVNVSVRRPGEEFGTRTETKNVNSIRFMIQVINYEVQRQIDILEEGGTIDQETRQFDPATGTTSGLRSKEEAHDYRYFPDPDLLPLEFSQEFVDDLARGLPELPDAKRLRLVKDLGISEYNAAVLVAEKENADYFEDLLEAFSQKTGKDKAELASQAANWVIVDLFGALKKAGKSITDSPVGTKDGAELLALQVDGTISGRIAKDVFEIMLESGKSPEAIVEEKGLKQVSDTGAIEAMIDEVLSANQDKVEQYRGGKDKLFGFFVGQVMKKTQGKANPQVVNELLRPKLDG